MSGERTIDFVFLCCIAMIQLYEYTDAGKYETLTTLCCSGTERLLTSWLLVFRHEERERHNFYYADSSYITLSHPHPSWPGPARPRVKSQLTSFSKSPNSQPITSGHDVIYTPVTFPIWGFYNDICDCLILCTRAWTALNVCAPALRAEQFKAQPNRMIKYK